MKEPKNYRKKNKYEPGDLAIEGTLGEIVLIIEYYDDADAIEQNNVWEHRWLMEPEGQYRSTFYYDIMYSSGIVEHGVAEMWLEPWTERRFKNHPKRSTGVTVH